MFGVSKKGKEKSIARQLDLQHVQLTFSLESLSSLNHKIDEIRARLTDLERKLDEKVTTTTPVKDKINSAIKLMLHKHGKLTSSQLSEMINLSRTRCNEYLKEMERDGTAFSTTVSRQKFYSLKR